METLKLRFTKEFECASFLHDMVTSERHPSGNVKKVGGRFVYVTILIEKGRPKDDFL